jgi:hypothetical protein
LRSHRESRAFPTKLVGFTTISTIKRERKIVSVEMRRDDIDGCASSPGPASGACRLRSALPSTRTSPARKLLDAGFGS